MYHVSVCVGPLTAEATWVVKVQSLMSPSHGSRHPRHFQFLLLGRGWVPRFGPTGQRLVQMPSKLEHIMPWKWSLGKMASSDTSPYWMKMVMFWWICLERWWPMRLWRRQGPLMSEWRTLIAFPLVSLIGTRLWSPCCWPPFAIQQDSLSPSTLKRMRWRAPFLFGGMWMLHCFGFAAAFLAVSTSGQVPWQVRGPNNWIMTWAIWLFWLWYVEWLSFLCQSTPWATLWLLLSFFCVALACTFLPKSSTQRGSWKRLSCGQLPIMPEQVVLQSLWHWLAWLTLFYFSKGRRFQPPFSCHWAQPLQNWVWWSILVSCITSWSGPNVLMEFNVLQVINSTWQRPPWSFVPMVLLKQLVLQLPSAELSCPVATIGFLPPSWEWLWTSQLVWVGRALP